MEDIVGVSSMAFTVIENICGALVLMFGGGAAVPLSLSVTVTFADPLAFGAGVKFKVPDVLIVGWVENNALLSLVTLKVRV